MSFGSDNLALLTVVPSTAANRAITRLQTEQLLCGIQREPIRQRPPAATAAKPYLELLWVAACWLGSVWGCFSVLTDTPQCARFVNQRVFDFI
ncbi:hypothetical protein D9M68_741730 [compost metagenome]